MANMSYCRFRNTYNDMMDCLDAIYDSEKLLDDEFVACKNMFESVLEMFEYYDICEVDYDEFNKWLDTIDRR